MKKAKKHLWRESISPKAELREGLLELVFWLAVLAVACGVLLLFAKLFPDTSISADLSMYIAMGGVTLIAFAVIWFFVKHKENRGHYTSFSELCREIQKKAPDWVPTKDGLRVIYQGTSLAISGSSVQKRCTCTLIRGDGTQLVRSFTYDETHQIILDFLHDQCIGAQVVEITDDEITKMQDHLVFYTDDFGREHVIDLNQCAKNFVQTHPQSATCVGERNMADHSFFLHTSPLPTRIVFDRKRITNRKKHTLIGDRDARFQDFNRLLQTQNYTTYDLS